MHSCRLPILASPELHGSLNHHERTSSGIAWPSEQRNEVPENENIVQWLNGGTRYLFNPFTIASCLGRPTSVFTNCAVLYAISKAVTGRPLNSMLALGLASYLSLYPTLLLPPLILLCYDQKARDTKTPPAISAFATMYITAFAAILSCLLLMSSVLTGGSWEFLSSTYGVHLLLPDLTPNIGLWWYFFIEMFDSFREFFLGVFWLHLGGYVGGLCFRIRTQPLFIITMMLGIFAIFKPYPSVSDTSLFFAMLPLYRHIYPREPPISNFSFPRSNRRP